MFCKILKCNFGISCLVLLDGDSPELFSRSFQLVLPALPRVQALSSSRGNRYVNEDIERLCDISSRHATATREVVDLQQQTVERFIVLIFISYDFSSHCGFGCKSGQDAIKSALFGDNEMTPRHSSPSYSMAVNKNPILTTCSTICFLDFWTVLLLQLCLLPLRLLSVAVLKPQNAQLMLILVYLLMYMPPQARFFA
jgi:hypothetical protein